MKSSEIRVAVLQELARVGLSGAENKFPAEISGGMRKTGGAGKVPGNASGDSSL